MKITRQLMILVTAALFALGCEKKGDTKETSVTATEKPTIIQAEATVPATETVAPQIDPVAPETEAADSKAPTETKNAAETKPAPALNDLLWVKGSPVTFEPDKVYIVEFWATWCPPCRESIPHLTEIQKHYKDKNVTVIGISTELAETVKPFVEKMGDQMDYTVAVDVKGNAQKNYMEAFKINGIPHAFIVDGSGKIVWNGHPLIEMDTILDLVVAGNFDPAAYAKQKAEAEALQQQIMAWYMDYFRKIEAGGLTDETKQLASNFIEKAPADGLNAFAWTILTRVQEANRDTEAALKAAQKANELTGGKDPSVLDTYALALFTNGKVSEAVEVQQKAVDSVSDYPDAQKQLRQTLEKYKAALGEQI